jgi:hypothetical protein
MFFTVAWSAQNSRFTMQIYETCGKCRSYRFSIDDDAPLRKMYKYELAKMYFPDAASDSAARHDALYLIERARQPKGRLSDLDGQLCREDGNVYLWDVLSDLGYFGTMKHYEPAHVAAILHFLGPFPDAEDLMPEA